MTITDIIVVFALLITLGAATAYLIREKKKGKRCVGCPYSNTCHQESKKREDCSCRCHDEEE